MRSGENQPPSIEVAQTIVQTLVTAGVTRFVYSPGSRNAPFAYVLAQFEEQGLIRVFPFAEERGGAFWAVGALRAASGGASNPVAVVTTSGTAVAELHPALEEAKHSGLPLIAVTADRPFEVQGTGASQTTTQAGIFGPTVVAYCNLPALTVATPALLGSVGSQVQRLVADAKGVGGYPGPAHLNVALREPLVPSTELDPLAARLAKNPLYFAEAETGAVKWEAVVKPGLSTAVVVGDLATAEEREVVEAVLAGSSYLPLLAEPSSGMTHLANWVPHAPWVVPFWRPQVEQVVVFGKPTLSRPVAQLLGDRNIRKVVVSGGRPWNDPAGTAAVVVDRVAPPAVTSRANQDRSWLDGWLRSGEVVGSVVENLSDTSALNQLQVARSVWDSPTECSLWLGASSIIRSFELVASKPGVADVYSNRGLAGIDGTIASALGYQSAVKRPVRVVLGDLTFAYDLPSLAARPEVDQDVQIVVIDDAGGAIFESLEHGRAASPEMYERFFAVRQQVDVIGAAQACGWQGREVTTLTELQAELAKPIHGRSVLYVRLPRPTVLLEQVGQEVAVALADVDLRKDDSNG